MFSIIKYIENKNVLSIDVWVGIVLFFLLPTSEPIFLQNTVYETAAITTTIVGLLLTTIWFIMCSKLRNYRYLDIHINCSKAPRAFLPIYLSILVLSLFLLIVYLQLSLYILLKILLDVATVSMLSLHLNNIQDLKLKEVS